MNLYCCECQKDVEARLTNGEELYPHRRDLAQVPFWKCDTCSNYVGCHYKTADPTRPMGIIPTRALMEARRKIHDLLDPLWKSGMVSRAKLYARIAKILGLDEYHTGNIRSLEEARKVYRVVLNISRYLPTE